MKIEIVRWTICIVVFIAGVIGISGGLSPDPDPVLGRASDVLTTPVSIAWYSADDQARQLLAEAAMKSVSRLPIESELQEPVAPRPRDPEGVPVAVETGEQEAAEQTASSWMVRPGDSMWKIATEVLGDSRRMAQIIALNPGIVPDRLQEGQVIRLPGIDKQPQVSSQESIDLVHTVKDGETLVSIARQHYGVEDWTSIQAANPELLKNPDHLKIGMRLKIPQRSRVPRGVNR